MNSNITWKAIKFKLFLYKKALVNRYIIKSGEEKKIVFIVGCQRSGTSLMSEIFELDLRTKIFGEVSVLSSDDDPKRLRLKSFSEVQKIINRQLANVIILKPLVESQHIDKLLKYFAGANAIWLYRDFRDVVSSNLIKFGIDTGIRDLKPIVKSDYNNWRSEILAKDTSKVIKRHFSDNMRFEDAAALFWWVRNKLFFDLELENNPHVTLCKYEDLVLSPIDSMQKIYSFLNLTYPDEKICKNIHSKSIKKGRSIKLSPEIFSLCEVMYNDLNKEYDKKID